MGGGDDVVLVGLNSGQVMEFVGPEMQVVRRTMECHPKGIKCLALDEKQERKDMLHKYVSVWTNSDDIYFRVISLRDHMMPEFG